jgi:hypothetical protein
LPHSRPQPIDMDAPIARPLIRSRIRAGVP